MKKLPLLVLLALLVYNSGYSIVPGILSADGSVPLPAQRANSINSLKAASLSALPEWKDFAKQNGDWTAMMDGLTGKPHRAFGKPIKISGFDEITNENALQAALSFLKENEKAFGISTDNLKLRHVTNVGDKWYVSFSQIVNGIDVLLSEVELRIHKNGNVFAFGIVCYDIPQLDFAKGISRSAILESAYSGIEFNPKTDIVQSDFKKYILPVRNSYGIEYKVVNEVSVIAGEFQNFISYVDENSGELVWRLNMVNNANTGGNGYIYVKGGIKLQNPSDTVEEVIFSNQYLTNGSAKYLTDSLGKATIPVYMIANVNATLEGPIVKVNRNQTSKNAKASILIGEEEVKHFNWDSSNSHLYERILFHHTNFIYDYHKMLDSELTAMDIQIVVTIYYDNQNTNAMSSGKNIYYIGVENPNIKFVESASVLYHEWGHSLNRLLYQQLGIQNGMINASCNEAHADITAAFILDAPEIGKGAFLNQPNMPYIRTCKNDVIYPDSLTYESHYDGRILSGAYWDLRELIGLEKAQHLSHFSKYGTPDDPNVGVAFFEWFFETLVTDDDDGDLTNGTPHYQEILEAFNNHKIGSGLFMLSSYSHVPHGDTKDTLNPYMLEFTLNGFNAPGCEIKDAELHYTCDYFRTFVSVECDEYGPGKFRAEIPPQKFGTIVNYYFTATDAPTNNVYRLDGNLGNTPKHYSFLVGFERVFHDDFNNGATVGEWFLSASDDNATQGRWEWDKPNSIIVQGLPYPNVQPSAGYQGGSDKCFVTGAKGTNTTYNQFMPNGKVTLISPDITVEGWNYPVARWQFWFYNIARLPYEQYQTYLNIDISSNGGSNWTNLIKTKDFTNGWEMMQFPVFEHIKPAEKFKLRFSVDAPKATGSNVYCYVEALLDELEIYQSLGEEIPLNVLPNEISLNPLMNSFPNPFSENVSITVNIPYQTEITISAYNALGVEVAKIIQTQCEAGEYIFRWDGVSSSGNKLPPGIYFIKLIANGSIITGKIALE